MCVYCSTLCEGKQSVDSAFLLKIFTVSSKMKQEAHGPQLAHLCEIATGDMHLLKKTFFFNSVIGTIKRIII